MTKNARINKKKFLLFNKKVKTKKCSRCGRAIRRNNNTFLCSNCFGLEYKLNYIRQKK